MPTAAAEELLDDDDAADDDAGEEVSPAAASPPTAIVEVLGVPPSPRCGISASCASDIPTAVRTTDRGFADLSVVALVDGSCVAVMDGATALAVVDVALAVSLAFFSDVGWWVSVAVCAGVGGVTCGETSALAVSVTSIVEVAVPLGSWRVSDACTVAVT